MISIVIPHAGPLEPLKRCLESIKRCTSAPYETIVVADSPSAEIRAYLDSLEVRVIYNEDIKGAEAALNQGFRTAKGDYLCFLMADIELSPRALEAMRDALERHKEFGWVALSSEYTGFLAGCSMMTRETFEKVGLWDESYLSGGGFSDDDYLRRMWKAGYKPHIVEEVKVSHKATEKALNEEERRRRFAQNQALFKQRHGAEGTNWDNLPRYNPKESAVAEVKLNLGSFQDTIGHGFTNIDILNVKPFIPADHIFKQWDLRRGIPYPNDSVDLIRCSHLIEHLTLDEAKNLLREIYRCLKTGGLARISTPDLDVILRHYRTRDMSFFNAIQPPEYIMAPTEGERFSKLLFSGDYSHKAVYSWQMLEGFLREAGFTKVFRSAPGFSHSEIIQQETTDQHEIISLYVEAVK